MDGTWLLNNPPFENEGFVGWARLIPYSLETLHIFFSPRLFSPLISSLLGNCFALFFFFFNYDTSFLLLNTSFFFLMLLWFFCFCSRFCLSLFLPCFPFLFIFWHPFVYEMLFAPFHLDLWFERGGWGNLKSFFLLGAHSPCFLCLFFFFYQFSLKIFFLLVFPPSPLV